MGYFSRYFRPVLPILCLLISGIAIYFVYAPHGMGTEAATIDAVISILLLIIAAWPTILLIRRYPTRVGIQVYAVLPVMITAIAATLFDWLILSWLLASDPEYTQWLESTIWARGLIALFCLGWISCLYAMRLKLEQTEAAFHHQVDAEGLLREAELFKLRQQLHPHFLYNSLNSINALILTQPDKAQEMIGQLSEFMRVSVKRDSNESVLLNEELDHIERYLSIEAIRFGDRLIINNHRQHEPDATIPPFLLQPIVENAIKYGLYGNTDKVAIAIRTSSTEALHKVEIANPYDPITPGPSGTGFGLEGVRRRLYLQFGRNDLVETHREANLFTTILKIPRTDV